MPYKLLNNCGMLRMLTTHSGPFDDDSCAIDVVRKTYEDVHENSGKKAPRGVTKVSLEKYRGKPIEKLVQKPVRRPYEKFMEMYRNCLECTKFPLYFCGDSTPTGAAVLYVTAIYSGAARHAREAVRDAVEDGKTASRAEFSDAVRSYRDRTPIRAEELALARLDTFGIHNLSCEPVHRKNITNELVISVSNDTHITKPVVMTGHDVELIYDALTMDDIPQAGLAAAAKIELWPTTVRELRKRLRHHRAK